MHAALLETPRPLTEEKVEAAARKAGADWDRLQKDMVDHSKDIEDLLARNDYQAQLLGLDGTPGFIIGNTQSFGGMTLAQFEESVKHARDTAKSAGGKGQGALTRLLKFAALSLLAAAAPSAAADPARYMTAELITESTSPAPGSTILVGFRMTPRPGWHGYWSNPGDSGIAPSVQWTAPAGVTFGPLLHPEPTLLTADGISSFVHDGPHILLSRMTIGRGVEPRTAIPIKAKLNWAACTATQCVPLRATLEMQLVAGDGAASADRQALRSAAAKLPQRTDGGTFATSGKSLQLVFPASVLLDPRTTHFFPDQNDAFDTASGRTDRIDGTLVMNGQGAATLPASISGVVADGKRAYRVALTPAAAVTESPEAHAAPANPPDTREPPTRLEHPSPAPHANAPAGVAAQSPSKAPLWPWFAIAAALALGAALILRRR